MFYEIRDSILRRTRPT